MGIVLHFLIDMDPNSPTVSDLQALFLAAFSLPLATNVIVTTLIVGRIWYLSPRMASDMRSTQFPTGTGRAVIDIVVESGTLYFSGQLIFFILFAIALPAQNIVGPIAVQIYVRIPHHMEGWELL